MLKKKDWKELLQEFTDKVDKRERLIQSKINGFEEQARVIKVKIKENSAQMIELEMSENSNVERFKKENQKLRLELEEIRDSISGYENQLGTSRNFYAKDLDKVRDAANKAEEERLEEVKADYALLDDLEAKMDEIKKKMEQTRNKLQFSRTTVEDLKWNFSNIDSRVTNLSYHEQEYAIKSWLSGGDIESFFKKPEAPFGRKVIHVDTSPVEQEWVNIPSGLNS